MSQSPKDILANNAGAVASRRVRSTGAVVTVYRCDEAGLEDDSSTPWATVCETHSTIVTHATKTVALSWIAEPEGFCDECRDIIKRKGASS